MTNTVVTSLNPQVAKLISDARNAYLQHIRKMLGQPSLDVAFTESEFSKVGFSSRRRFQSFRWYGVLYARRHDYNR